ncbi:beta-lactamase family protein [Actinomadura barringtoniae]|uniref:Beta-lactamase family protein n=1 Tax=Actinomadura barringtoniae TaxID=1427535 RepID=A0A939PGV3_9ACTN|nr:serine hydrolase domain-containing protein [Actinomadura barringtoniae]MBO2452622.1 beta-lactamase family protein [Actinomadura barringtoniae]
MSDAQTRVQDAVDGLVETGKEIGVQVAVYHHGEQVVDAVAGAADSETGRPVEPGTPFYNFSIGKGVTATIAHVLAERGLFDYDTRVAELWPEFAAHGKENVTVRHVLNHSAGLPGVPVDATIEDVCDWDKMTAFLADAELWWEPGTEVGYHAYTFGYLVGEIVRRATGKPISEVLVEEVSGPLGVADEIYFAMPASEQARLARLEDEPGLGEMAGDMPPDLPMFKAGPLVLFPNAALGNRPDMLAATIPAGCKTSARAIAHMYAAVIGEVDGVRFLSPERLAQVWAVSATGTDQIFGNPSTWGLGYAGGFSGSDTEFGMAGAGGSYAGADTATGVAFAVTKNRFSMSFDSATEIIKLIRELYG